MGRIIFAWRDLHLADSLPESYISICLERSQVQCPSDTQCSLQDFFQPKIDNHAWFWNNFVTPIHDAQRMQKFHPKARPGGKLSLLEGLPSELIDELIDELYEVVT
jgi:hypothetical protein